VRICDAFLLFLLHVNVSFIDAETEIDMIPPTARRAS
jgi:hypothetical protein